ncbi:MAG TPA: hypothetical protein VN408_14750 [Actinoplanes sp.]|nr:hypothetical protein [Actinoplanes sp.]
MAPFGLVTLTAAALLVPGVPALADDTRTVLGTVESVVVDPLPGAAAHDDETLTYVRAEGRLLTVPDGSLDGAAPGRQARLTLDGGDVVAARLTGAAVRKTAATVTGAHTLTVLPVFWTAKDAETSTSLTTLANQAKAYWAEQSGGGVDISVDVRDWKSITAPTGSCDYTAVFNAALAAHGLSAPADAKNHVAVYFPKQSGCAWAGLGSINGSNIWINGYPIEDVLTHEFGHNLGLGHANKASCTTGGARVPLSSTCTVTEYQDTTDVMGSARTGVPSGNLNSAFGDLLGLQQVTTTAPAELTALSAHSGTSGLKLTTSAGTVFVDYRPATGRDTRVPAWAGVQVRLRTTANPPATQLLDMQPTTASAFTAANLPAGGMWPVPGTNQSVKVTSTTATTAKVELVTATDTTIPSVAPVLTVGAGPVKTATTAVTWTAATDTESGISAYRVTVNGATVVTTGGDARTADVPLTEGSNTIAVVAVNGSGLLKASTGKTLVRDSIAPAAVTNLTVAGGGRTVTWTGPADTGTARTYAVRVDGELVKTVTASPAAISLTSGRRTVSVTPSDAAGNTGSAVETSVWVDPDAPVPPVITAPAAGVWQNSRQVTVSWTPASATASGIKSYSVAVNGKTTTVAGDVTSATVPVNADGTHVVTVTATNMAGVVSKAATMKILVDTTAPTAPASLRLAADQSKLTWSQGSAAGSPVSWQVSVDGAAPVTVTRTEVPNTAAGGQRTWTVTPVDAAGNTGPAIQLTAWTDSTAPSAPVITAPAADGFLRLNPVTVTWDASSDAESGIASYLVTAGTQKTTVTGTSHTLRLPEGRQTVSVTAVNKAGLKSAPATVTLGFDPAAPSAVTGAKTTLSGSDTVLTWTAATDKTSGVAEYALYLDGEPNGTVTAPATTATVTTPPGKHTWTIAAVDKAGNTGKAVSAGTIWFDTTAPVAAVPVALPERLASRSVKVTWAAAADEESGIKSYTVIATDGTRTAKTAASASSIAGTVNVPADGTWTISVQATNQAGLSTTAPAGTVLVDATTPGAPVITSPSAGATTGRSVTVTWNAPSAGPSGIRKYLVTVNGKAYDILDGTDVQVPVELPDVAAGKVTITVTAVSGAGLLGKPGAVAVIVR